MNKLLKQKLLKFKVIKLRLINKLHIVKCYLLLSQLLQLNQVFKNMLTFFLVIGVYWLLMSLLAYSQVTKMFKYFRSLPTIQIKEKWKAFVNEDTEKWDQKKIIIGCFARFPFNFTALVMLLLTLVPFIYLSKLFGRKMKMHIINFWKWYSNIVFRIVFKVVEQEEYSKFKIQTPFVVSNHINWIDPWYYVITFMPLSPVSKAAIKNQPVIGAVGEAIQAIYVDRSNQSQKDLVIQKISERVRQFNQNKNKPDYQQTPPLVIFPQGTTSNGKNILTFKMGAFNDLAPITLFATKYSCEQFSMGMGELTQTMHLFTCLCLRPTIETKHKIMRPVQGESAQDYCKRCRDEMSRMTGLPLVQSGYRDEKQFEQARKESLRTKKQ